MSNSLIPPPVLINKKSNSLCNNNNKENEKKRSQIYFWMLDDRVKINQSFFDSESMLCYILKRTFEISGINVIYVVRMSVLRFTYFLNIFVSLLIRKNEINKILNSSCVTTINCFKSKCLCICLYECSTQLEDEEYNYLFPLVPYRTNTCA